MSDQFDSELRVPLWIILIFNVILAVGFFASSYGLSMRQNWGRVLFLWLIVLWSVANLMALLYSILRANKIVSFHFVDSLRYLIALIMPLWYLNLPHIKTIFKTEG
jgi:hypothetical protein